MQGRDRRSICGALVAFSLFCSAGASSATEAQNTLVVLFPKSVPKGVVAKIAVDAFMGRKWSVVRASRDQVTGKIDHRGISATLELTILDDRITYSCGRTDPPPLGDTRSAGPAPRSQLAAGVRSCNIRKLQGWINNLRRDIEGRLARAELEGTDDDGDRASVTERLSTLEALRSEGLVSQQEYDAKRAQILSEF